MFIICIHHDERRVLRTLPIMLHIIIRTWCISVKVEILEEECAVVKGYKCAPDTVCPGDDVTQQKLTFRDGRARGRHEARGERHTAQGRL